MTADDVVQLIVVKELPGDIRPKLATHAPFTWRSAKHGLGVGPQQLTHDPLLRRLPASFRGTDVVQHDVVLGEQAPVHHQHLACQAVTQWQPVVHLREQLTHVGRVLCLHLPLEPVHLVHVLALVVTSGHEERIGVEEFEAKEDEYALNREGTPINEVSIKEVGILGAWKPVESEDVHEVKELAVDISANCELGPIGDGNFH